MSPRVPATRSPTPPALTRTLGGQVRHLFGLRQTITVGQVRYRERTPEPLRHALSRKGRGFKEFDAVFPDGPGLRITATPQRHYADLTGPRLLPVLESAADWITPGLRVVLLGGGTGYAAAWLAERVGPSGAVVSLEPDEESIAYARRRYPPPNIAFEGGGVEALSGETDGAFDAAISLETLGRTVVGADQATDGSPAYRIMAELWRVVGAPGWMLACEPVLGLRDSAAAQAGPLEAMLKEVVTQHSDPSSESQPGRRPDVQTLVDIHDGWIYLVARREALD